MSNRFVLADGEREILSVAADGLFSLAENLSVEDLREAIGLLVGRVVSLSTLAPPDSPYRLQLPKVVQIHSIKDCEDEEDGGESFIRTFALRDDGQIFTTRGGSNTWTRVSSVPGTEPVRAVGRIILREDRGG